MRIEVYILTNKKPCLQKHAKARWAVAAYDGASIDEMSLIWKRDGVVVGNNTTSKKVSLYALRDALKRFTKPAIINLYIEDPFVRNMMQQNMPHRWSCHMWKKFRYDREIRYCDLWREIYGLIGKHAVKYAAYEEMAGKQIIKELEVK